MSEPLRLKAETKEDLSVLSASLQDAIGRVGDISYKARSHAFTMRLSRFKHEDDSSAERILSGLRIDGVLGARLRGIDRSDPDAMLVLLTLIFTPDDTGLSGKLALVFAGGGEISLDIECLDIILADISKARITDKVPLHPLQEGL